MPLPEIVKLVKMKVPNASLEFITLPADPTGSYRFDFIGPYVSKEGKRQMMIADQYSGKILLNSNTDFPNVGQAYLSWLTPIHYGSFGGLPTKILALLGGLIPLTLFITGFIIWWPRHRKQKRKTIKKPRKPVMKPDNAETPLTIWQYFSFHYTKGIKYGLWTLLFSLIMGALYGAVSGILLQPAAFSLIFGGILVVANFLVAMIVFVFNLIFLAPFKKGYRPIFKYFALSFAFFCLFVPVVVLINLSGINIF